MALDPVRLDDLTWQQMVESVRGRIAAASAGNWSLHAPTDPGVTLLELFAWLLEQRVFMLDQTSPALIHAMLGLMGERPRKTTVAATVMAFATPELLAVPRGTTMQLEGRTPPLTFSTKHAFTALPFADEGIALYIGGRDRTADLHQRRLVRLFEFPTPGSSTAARILLRLKQPLHDPLPPEPLSLFLEMATSVDVIDADLPRKGKRVAAEWEAHAMSVPAPAAVSWWYRSTTSGELVRWSGIRDGTGGLRRSGVVRLPIPRDWQPEEKDTATYAIHLIAERHTFTAPPRLLGILANAVVARHWRRVRHAGNADWFRLARPHGQVIVSTLPESSPHKDHPPLEQTMRLRLGDHGDGSLHIWKHVPSLALRGPGDRVFVVDRQKGILNFGNGYTGRIPRPGPKVEIGVEYFVGGGETGNLPPGLRWLTYASAQSQLSQLRGTNAVAASGGAEAATLAQVMESVPGALRRVTRAVTANDYETLAITTPGVAIRRARCAIGHDPCNPCQVVPGAITVFILPDAPREGEDPSIGDSAFVEAPITDAGALAAVRARLEKARLLGTELYVLNPRYRPVALNLVVDANPLDPTDLEHRIHARLHQFLDPLIGGNDGQGWPFGEPLRPSVLLYQAQQAIGDDGEVASIAIGLDGAAPQVGCSDVEIGAHDLVYLATSRVRLRRLAAAIGGLR